MGSDAVKKSRKPARSHRCLLAAVAGAFFTCIVFWTWKPASFPSDNMDLIPPGCLEYATRFHRCQQNPIHRIVIGCHRKWCGSFGYCSPGGGLGSRTRYALTMIQRAVDLCIRVEVDAPSTALLTAEDAIYVDPMGLAAELLHFRSYGNRIEDSREAWKGNMSDWTRKDTFYLHITPRHWTSPRVNGMPVFDYDPCLFHLLFRPSPLLQKEIDMQYERMGRTIGIHFRTGDAVAFHHLSGGDVRVSTDLRHALEQLLQCARDFASTHQGITATRFYLATDNHKVQELAKHHPELITLDLNRHSWRHHDEYDAWLEVFLLSKMAGIVVNELDDKNYHGVGDRISTYARLAAKIGFMEDNQLYPCKIQQ